MFNTAFDPRYVELRFAFIMESTDHGTARGTMEAKGYGAAGGSLIAELKKLVPEVTTYAVDYPVRTNINTYWRMQH
jgi:hypothetical protein